MPPGTDGSRLISSAIELQASSRSSSPHGLYDTKHSYSLLSFLLIFLLCYFPLFSFPFLFILTFVPFLLPPFFNCLMTFFHSSYVLTSFHIFPSSHRSCYLPFFLLKSSLLLIISWFLPCILISIFFHSFLPPFSIFIFLSFDSFLPSNQSVCRLLSQYCGRCHATKTQPQVLNNIVPMGEGDAHRCCDDTDVILTARGLFVGRHKLSLQVENKVADWQNTWGGHRKWLEGFKCNRK